MMSRLGAAVLAAALITAQTAFADGTATPSPAVSAVAPTLAPLAPGKAAGIQPAQTNKQLSGIAIGAGLLLGAVAIYLIVGTHYHVPSQNTSGTH